MRILLSILRKISLWQWAFAGILMFGIFLRTYHFHDWLRFSLDQSRDAMIIGGAVDASNSLPLLGPIAGGTDFHLGPAYYYFSYFFAKIFGNEPDVMAYPSLIFSIASIALAYRFLREYFDEKISLFLMLILSVSSFMVAYSRFSSNPNLSPFFIILFLLAFLRLLDREEKRLSLWAILLGISLGIGIQLHTTLLVILPICTVLALGYILRMRGIMFLKQCVMIVIVCLILNVPQIVSEVRTDGYNMHQFLIALNGGGRDKADLMGNAMNIVSCQMKANAHILASIPVLESCSKGIDTRITHGSKKLYKDIKNQVFRKISYGANISFVFFFLFGGYCLMARAFVLERDEKKKNFLGMVLFFDLVTLGIFIPVANSLYVNYFIILFFLPFVFFGLGMEFLREKFKSFGMNIVIGLVVAVISLGVFANVNTARWYAQGFDNDAENTDLREIESVARFMLENIGNDEPIYLDGEGKYLRRYARPLGYMIERNGRIFMDAEDDRLEYQKTPPKYFFYIKNDGKEDIQKQKIINGYAVVAARRFYAIDIYMLNRDSGL